MVHSSKVHHPQSPPRAARSCASWPGRPVHPPAGIARRRPGTPLREAVPVAVLLAACCRVPGRPTRCMIFSATATATTPSALPGNHQACLD
jgi:hypothetical protein